MSVPGDWKVEPQTPTQSPVPGYDYIDILFGSDPDADHKQIVRFLLSKDRQQLAKLSTFPLNKIQGSQINTVGRPVRGSQSAGLEIIVFDDLQCPFCARMHAELISDTMAQYKSLVKVVYKDDPLVGVHPWAMHAAVNANCIAAQSADAYWHFVDAVHAQSKEITGSNSNINNSTRMLDSIATEEGRHAGLDLATLAGCIKKEDESAIFASINEAKALRVNSLPTLFIGGERLTGAQSEPILRATIDRALKANGIQPPS
jgi:protein-disulfide isomerase